jgi:hypothetical protein
MEKGDILHILDARQAGDNPYKMRIDFLRPQPC